MTMTEKQMEIILDALTDKIRDLEIWQQIHEEEIEEIKQENKKLNEMLYGKKEA